MLVDPFTTKPQRDWVPFLCEDKETGKEVLIKSKCFDERRWKFIKEMPHKDAPKQSPVLVGVAPKVEKVEEKPKVITPEERFAYLKSKGWSKLDASERKNYKELKTQLEKPRFDVAPKK